MRIRYVLSLGVLCLFFSFMVVSPATAQNKKKAAAGSPGGITGVTVTLGSAGPVVTWQPISGAQYAITRAKADDAACCNNSAAGLVATTWQDSPLPVSGNYVYRVTAVQSGKTVTGEATFAYQKPVTATGTAVTGTPVTGTATTISGPTLITGTLTTAAAPTSGRFRVTLNGFRVTRETYDDALERDGKRDEVYASSVAVLWDRKLNQYGGIRMARTREYGDIGNPVVFPERVRAGTASPAGGLWAGTGGDIAPADYNPSGPPSRGPSVDQFPLLVWEGTLTDGVEALVVAPSLWERDTEPNSFRNYLATWNSGSSSAMALITSTIAAQAAASAPTVSLAPINPQQVASSTLSNMFLNALTGSFGVMAALFSGSPDRPIGMSGIVGGATWYQERFVVLTREKLASLTAPGVATIVTIPLGDAPDPQLGGQYQLYLRVERVQ